MNEKAEKYIGLVQSVKQKYKCCEQDEKAKFIWCDLKDDEDLCMEINLWTYWQGWNYSENTPKIKYLLLGQDFGPAAREEAKGTISNVRRLNAGEATAMFQDSVNLNSRDAKTDKSLVELFAAIGYPNIDKKRYSELFFCNFCLGYRKHNYTGSFSKTDFRADKEYIKELVDILCPEHIICLGHDVAIETIRLLVNPDYPDKSMDELIASKDISKYNGSSIHPMAHPGFWGLRNRGGIEKVIEDWKNMINN